MSKSSLTVASLEIDTGCLIVPNRRRATVRRLCRLLKRISRDQSHSMNSLATDAKVTRDSVVRMFDGYTPLGETRVADPSTPGRVRLHTFLAVVHALGYDLEVVTRRDRRVEAGTPTSGASV